MKKGSALRDPNDLVLASPSNPVLFQLDHEFGNVPFFGSNISGEQLIIWGEAGQINLVAPPPTTLLICE